MHCPVVEPNGSRQLELPNRAFASCTAAGWCVSISYLSQGYNDVMSSVDIQLATLRLLLDALAV